MRYIDLRFIYLLTYCPRDVFRLLGKVLAQSGLVWEMAVYYSRIVAIVVVVVVVVAVMFVILQVKEDVEVLQVGLILC